MHMPLLLVCCCSCAHCFASVIVVATDVAVAVVAAVVVSLMKCPLFVHKFFGPLASYLLLLALKWPRIRS